MNPDTRTSTTSRRPRTRSHPAWCGIEADLLAAPRGARCRPGSHHRVLLAPRKAHLAGVAEAIRSFREHDACLAGRIREQQHQGRRASGWRRAPSVSSRAVPRAGPAAPGRWRGSPMRQRIGQIGSDGRRRSRSASVRLPADAREPRSGGSIVDAPPERQHPEATQMPGVEQPDHARSRREVVSALVAGSRPRSYSSSPSPSSASSRACVVEPSRSRPSQVGRPLQVADVDVGGQVLASDARRTDRHLPHGRDRSPACPPCAAVRTARRPGGRSR